ncbi:hypothetical protein GPECTOR_39g463 [Gonium pectorale]|uniref:Uncharacterized protein n=1 Tax=Gonium pectorale TaxID=33097 RepID=A0A150GAW0_GONPE|nr:hypothetical protein GPECTOR_39g463 [Gonium pectorale]|eukprot:KXZ46969.1 hypothetical protein GPECTOR_39g463 [Gonium pectorale]
MAVASDGGVQLGFGLSNLGGPAASTSLAGPAAASSASGRSGSGGNVVIPPGLDSPGYGELSPAGGPDRLTIEPPVGDMAAASLSTPMSTSPARAPGGCFFWRYGASARARAAVQVQEAAVHAAAAPDGPGRGPAMAAGNPVSSSTPPAHAPIMANGAAAGAVRRSSLDDRSGVGHSQHRTGASSSQDGGVTCYHHSLEAEIGRVVEFVNGQTDIAEDLRAVSLSQCQFLLDCLHKPDMCWLVGDSLLQLKHEVGFPFDTGCPIPGASDWFRLVLQPLQPPPPQLPQQQGTGAAGNGTGAAPAAQADPAAEGTQETQLAAFSQPMPPPPLSVPEVLKVRWARIDQRQCGGANACAAIVLEVAAWCLGAVQRWRSAVTAAAGTGSSCSAPGSASRSGSFGRGDGPRPGPMRPLPELGRSGSAGAAGHGRRELPPLLTRSQRERIASAMEVEAMTGEALEECIRTGTAVWQGLLMQSPASRLASSTGDFDLEHMTRQSLGGVPLFANLVRRLPEGVYVLGFHGHFATLWLRPGGVVHLIDSLGARLAADCPLAFVLEFGSLGDFLAFFLSRHQRRDLAGSEDIVGANLAALVEVHRMELQARAR